MQISSVGQGLGQRLLAGRRIRLELATGLVVGELDLLAVPVDHPGRELLELRPAVEVLEQVDLVAPLLILHPGEEGLARPRGRAPARGTGRVGGRGVRGGAVRGRRGRRGRYLGDGRLALADEGGDAVSVEVAA